SRRNFEMASILVNPGDPATSRLLQQPLAPEAGGNVFHSGGRQFASKDDPNWEILADWVHGGSGRTRCAARLHPAVDRATLTTRVPDGGGHETACRCGRAAPRRKQ